MGILILSPAAGTLPPSQFAPTVQSELVEPFQVLLAAKVLFVDKEIERNPTIMIKLNFEDSLFTTQLFSVIHIITLG